MSGYRIRPLDAAVDSGTFRCGQAALDSYICRYASQDVRRGVARVFIASPEDAPGRLSGFFSLSAGSVQATDLPEALRRKLPRYPIPVALLGRLAVDVTYQGKGLGSIMLADACQKVAQASAILAVAGIIVDAKDDSAAQFYQHFGFLPLPGVPGRLMLPSRQFIPSH